MTDPDTTMLTWLNGRASKIYVHHEGRRHLLWQPEDGTSIEDMIIHFCDKHGIDMDKEVEIPES
jgi:hypothetical protein